MKKIFIAIIFTPLIAHAAEQSFLTHNIDFGLGIPQIEQEGITNSATNNSSITSWKDKDSWKMIKKGSSFEEVEKILGEPTKIETVTPNVVTWYYTGSVDSAYPSVSGHVFFGSKTVSIIKEPQW